LLKVVEEHQMVRSFGLNVLIWYSEVDDDLDRFLDPANEQAGFLFGISGGPSVKGTVLCRRTSFPASQATTGDPSM
jgi:hypothetical protein